MTSALQNITELSSSPPLSSPNQIQVTKLWVQVKSESSPTPQGPSPNQVLVHKVQVQAQMRSRVNRTTEKYYFHTHKIRHSIMLNTLWNLLLQQFLFWWGFFKCRTKLDMIPHASKMFFFQNLQDIFLLRCAREQLRTSLTFSVHTVTACTHHTHTSFLHSFLHVHPTLI